MSDNKNTQVDEKLVHDEWNVENSLTAPSDRDRVNKP